MKALQSLFRVLPSIALLVLSFVIVIFDLGSIPWVETLRYVFFGATIWQFCIACSGLMKVVCQE